MNKKIFFTCLMLTFFIVSIFSYSYAAENMMDNAKNAVMNVGNSIGNAAASAKNTIVNGAKDITNGASQLGEDAMNTAENGEKDNDGDAMESSAVDTLGNGDSSYTASRTSTTADSANLLGMSSTTWTWLIMGIVGIIIVALVWYYGAQYEHKNYNN